MIEALGYALLAAVIVAVSWASYRQYQLASLEYRRVIERGAVFFREWRADWHDARTLQDVVWQLGLLLLLGLLFASIAVLAALYVAFVALLWWLVTA